MIRYKFNSLKNLSSYGNLNGSEKLRCLQLCDIEISTLDEFDKILPEIDLNDPANKEYFSPWFFKKARVPLCDILKSNWPMWIKSIAFRCSPDFWLTQRNCDTIFISEIIKWLLYESQEKNNFMQNLSFIKSELRSLISKSEPDFELDIESRDEIFKLKDKIDLANTPDEIKDLLIAIPDTMKNIIEKNIKSYVEVIIDIIQDQENEDVAKELLDYLYGKKEKIPDAFNKNEYIARFLENAKRTIQDINKQRNEKIIEDDSIAYGFAAAGFVGLIAVDPFVLLLVNLLLPANLHWYETVAFSAIISNPASLIFLGATGALFVTAIALVFYNNSEYANKNFYSKIFPYPDKIKQMVDHLKDVINKNPNFKKQVEKTQKLVEQKKYDNANLGERNINVFVNINQFKNAKRIIKQKNQDTKTEANPMKKVKDKNSKIKTEPKNFGE